MTSPAAGAHPRVRIVTTKGNVYVTLFPEWAPLTVANFLGLARAGYYDGNRWFRIVPDFVVQTGDPHDDGNGDAGYSLGAEENPLEQRSYVISMGLNYDGKTQTPIRDSAGTQYYVTLSPQYHLDRDFTVFGEVIGGFDVLANLIESDRVERVEQIADVTQARTLHASSRARGLPDPVDEFDVHVGAELAVGDVQAARGDRRSRRVRRASALALLPRLERTTAGGLCVRRRRG